MFSHSAAAVYIFCSITSKFFWRFINYRLLLIAFVLVVLFPLSNQFLIDVFSMVKESSSFLNRKIDFFLRDDNLDAAFSLYSTIVIPLHLTFLSIVFIFKDKIIKSNDYRIFLFIVLYLILLYTRDFSLLPTRLAMLIIMLSPIFIGYILIKFKSKLLRYIYFAYVGFCLISFARFSYLNDFGNNNITFFSNQLLTEYILR